MPCIPVLFTGVRKRISIMSIYHAILARTCPPLLWTNKPIPSPNSCRIHLPWRSHLPMLVLTFCLLVPLPFFRSYFVYTVELRGFTTCTGTECGD
jgi:hypothetical protein